MAFACTVPRVTESAEELDDGALAACRAGDRAALHRFVTRYQHMVFAFLSRSLGGGPHVEDLAQDVFLRTVARAAVVIAVSVAGAACVNSRPYTELAIDHAGFAGRLRRACELARGNAGAGVCATDETIEEDGSSDETAIEETADGGFVASDDGQTGRSPDVLSEDAIVDPP